MRHLLTKHGGHIALDRFQTVYIDEFGPPSSAEIQKYIGKKLPHFSFHVVNLASYKWAVWSPTGYPHYPQRWTAALEPVNPVSSGDSTSFSGSAVRSEEPSVGASASFVDDLVDLSDVLQVVDESSGPGGPHFGEFASSASNSVLSTVLGPIGDLPSFPTTTDRGGDLIDLSNVSGLATAAQNNEEGTGDSLFSKSASVPTLNARTLPSPGASLPGVTGPGASVPSFSDPGASWSGGIADSASEAPYDFLKQHPDLIAELSKSSSDELPLDDLAVLTEVLTLQRLKELGLEFPPAGGPPSTGLRVLSEEVPVLPPQDTANLSVDYIKLGWSPSQVLAELQRQKEACGGILPPNLMEPFIDYFGEMSSRELDRMELQEGRPKLNKGAAGRKKPNMAIRFPSQDKATPSKPPHPQESLVYGVSFSGGAMADVDTFSSSSSGGGGDGSPPVVPFDRNEHMRKFLRGEDPSNDALGTKVEGADTVQSEASCDTL